MLLVGEEVREDVKGGRSIHGLATSRRRSSISSGSTKISSHPNSRSNSRTLHTCESITYSCHTSLRQGNWEQTSVSRWKDSPDPLPYTDIVVYPGRVDKFETVTPERGFVRVISDSVRTVEQYGGVSIEIGEGLTTCIALDNAWTITSMMWEHLTAGWRGKNKDGL